MSRGCFRGTTLGFCVGRGEGERPSGVHDGRDSSRMGGSGWVPGPQRGMLPADPDGSRPWIVVHALTGGCGGDAGDETGLDQFLEGFRPPFLGGPELLESLLDLGEGDDPLRVLLGLALDCKIVEGSRGGIAGAGRGRIAGPIVAATSDHGGKQTQAGAQPHPGGWIHGTMGIGLG